MDDETTHGLSSIVYGLTCTKNSTASITPPTLDTLK
jgi:hypothetical protein